MSAAVVEVTQLTKRYGNRNAVNEVSFSLEADKIYGLLGRNGAGKTTIMHMLTAQLFPSSGTIKLFGEEPYENESALSRVCFIKESQKYPDAFRVIDVLKTASYLYPNWDMDYALSLAKEFRLPLDRRIKKLSRGMLSSVGIVTGLATRAPLTIFDEPYLGLDAVARSLFYDRLIEDYSAHPRTVILSTHLIDEVSRLLEHILLIDDGMLLVNEDADTLRERAFAVAGTTSAVEAFITGKQVLSRDQLGGLTTATIMGHLNGAERKYAAELGLELAPISLQQLVVHLTKNGSEKKGADGQ
ncbi:ABC transporter ATP-binding protein [Paenibacillus koleovorans]|uniref:ABC transporter ATP-binding protein n=1 Tax=Paenibacillus koleovorans TaxID=121608 RepID=UPI000FD81988|nr:ABC transporter ATP-binding protein [Paenibacillus koleovorans]